MFSAMAAVWTGKRIAVVTRLAEQDALGLDLLGAAGIDVYTTYAPVTTRHVAYHVSADEDQRRVLLLSSAGAPVAEELDGIEPTFLHLAALTDQESSLDFVKEAIRRGFRVSVDLQGFVRQADLVTGEVRYGDVSPKKEIVRVADKVKLDGLEAAFLTGLQTPELAAIEIERWGARETMITWSGGVLVRSEGKTYVESFSNAGIEGRTGRGDSTFGSYLACRLDQDVAEALRWAAAVASMKLETAGPFMGTRDQVRARLSTVRR
jgi:sugar/nucleoside kinase (ribokinase family)